MKKLLIISNLFWISVFIIFACRKPLQISSADCKTFCYDFRNEPFDGLSSFAAANMARNYQQIFTPTGTTIMDTTETKSVWFSLETIKNFIYQIESNSCALKCDSINAQNLGVRIYFAKYPNAGTLAAADSAFSFLARHPEYYGRKTLFMVPTYKSGVFNLDFDPIWSMKNDSKLCAPQSMKDIKNKNEQAFISPGSGAAFRMTVLAPGDPDGMRNKGGICPPNNCDGAF